MTPREALRLLEQIEAGEIRVEHIGNHENVNVEVYKASTGHLIGIFNDAGGFDYVEWIQPPGDVRVNPYDEINAGRDGEEKCRWSDVVNADVPDEWSLFHIWHWPFSSERMAVMCGSKGRKAGLKNSGVRSAMTFVGRASGAALTA